jgi:hypothetical protein
MYLCALYIGLRLYNGNESVDLVISTMALKLISNLLDRHSTNTLPTGVPSGMGSRKKNLQHWHEIQNTALYAQWLDRTTAGWEPIV